MDIKSMLSLDFDKGWQYRIILEGGLLLCQMSQIHKERHNLLKYVKKFIKKEVKLNHENLEGLKQLVSCVTPIEFKENYDESLENPLLEILVNALYNEYIKVKEAIQEAKAKAYQSES